LQGHYTEMPQELRGNILTFYDGLGTPTSAKDWDRVQKELGQLKCGLKHNFAVWQRYALFDVLLVCLEFSTSKCRELCAPLGLPASGLSIPGKTLLEGVP